MTLVEQVVISQNLTNCLLQILVIVTAVSNAIHQMWLCIFNINTVCFFKERPGKISREQNVVYRRILMVSLTMKMTTRL